MNRVYILSTFALLLIITSCKNTVRLTVTDPPAVYLEKEYVTAGVINRSFSKGAAQVLDVIDNLLGLEGNLDSKGSNAATQGMFDELTTNKRFEYVAILDSIAVENRAADVFPAPMDWSEVTRICQENGVQVLFVLEVFDTDTKVDYNMTMVNQNTPLGTVQVPRHSATATTKVTTGWRIYDPKNKIIRDEYFVRDRIRNTGSGINPAKAASVLMNRGQAVTQISTQVGRFYAGRVRTQSFRVSREYFKAGSQNLKIGHRRALVNDWDGSAEVWLKDTESSKRKVAGRACHNMAIDAEINGDIKGALKWAQKAYTDYRIKESKNYARILSDRVFRWEKAQQLKEIDDNNN
ncbi:MAG: hypothetical protein ACI857_001570 [Arenicella sp.]|jgi:hypothetical protein